MAANTNTARYTYLKNRLKYVAVSETILRDVLELPDDVQVMRIDYDYMRRSLIVTVSKDTWEEVPPGAEPPMVLAEYVAVHRAEHQAGVVTPVQEVHQHFKIDWED